MGAGAPKVKQKQARVVLVGYEREEFKSNEWERRAAQRCRELGMHPLATKMYIEKVLHESRKLRRKNSRNVFIRELMAEGVKVHLRLLDEKKQ